MSALIATGVSKYAVCQPDAVSATNVARPSSVPVSVQMFPRCVPPFDVAPL